MSQSQASVLAWVALSLLSLGIVLGGDQARAGEGLEELRELHQEGAIQSLEAILERARERVPGGRLVEAELHREGEQLLYEVEFIDQQGVLRELFFDARDGTYIPGEPVREEQEHH